VFGFLHSASEPSLIRLRNPLQSERDVMRPTLVPSLLEIVASNLKHESTVCIAELAHVYLDGKGDELPDERNLLALAMTGSRDPFGRFGSSGTIDYFDLKGIVDELMSSFRLPGATVSRADHPGLHPGRSATVSVGDTPIALLGELRPDVAAAFGLEDQRVAVSEIDLDRVLALQSADPVQVRVPHYLPVHQDFAIVVEESSPAADVEAALRAGAGPLVTNVTLFDVFTGNPIPNGKKSLAYRVTFTAPDRPLTDADLGKVRGRIERSLAQRVNGVLRA
jgi:phenylalanyl-tRNA synthetase beta chain